MKIPRRIVVKIAIQVIKERGAVTQFDIHTAIEEYLNRQLSVGDKVRITKILESEFNIVEVRREGADKIRVYVFEL